MIYWLSFELRMLPGEGDPILWDAPNMQAVPSVGDRVRWSGDDGVDVEVTGTYVVSERTFTYEYRPDEDKWVCSVRCVADQIATDDV